MNQHEVTTQMNLHQHMSMLDQGTLMGDPYLINCALRNILATLGDTAFPPDHALLPRLMLFLMRAKGLGTMRSAAVERLLETVEQGGTIAEIEDSAAVVRRAGA